MKYDEMKDKTIVLIEYERSYPEEQSEENKRDGVVSYFLNKDKVVGIEKAKIYFIESKHDSIDGPLICRLYFKSENGRRGSIRVKPKTTFEEVSPTIYLDSSLLHLRDQVISLLKS